MTLSIVITYYKGEKFITRLLESIKNSYACSKQKIGLEVIIVVDSPNDDVEQLNRILDFVFNRESNIFVNLIRNEQNLGVDRSRDLGVRYANYEWITVFDQDDFMSNNYFLELEQNLEETVLFYFLNGVILNTISNKSIPMYYFMPKITFKKLIKNNIILSPSFLIFNRSYITSNHIMFTLPFQDEKGVDDWFFLLQLLVQNPNPTYKVINKKLINYCIHETNYSHRVGEMINGSIKVLDSIKIDDEKFKRLVNLKKKSLQYSLTNLKEKEQHTLAITSKGRFSYYHFFLSDLNRVLRFIHRRIIGLEIRV